MSGGDLSDVAVTTRPGLIHSLRVGGEAGLGLAREWGLGLVPVHHMRAHALTARLAHPDLRFPFLALLVSGGHAVLALVSGPEVFRLLGSSVDIAPGELMDKVARRLRLRFLKPGYEALSGGRLVELGAEGGDPLYLHHKAPLGHARDCDFSFGGMRLRTEKRIVEVEKEEGVVGLGFSSQVPNLCASLQHAVFHHLARRLMRAIEVLNELKKEGGSEFDHGESLVISGGCAANSYLRNGLSYVAQQYGFRTFVPPVSLCGDNGSMIAWTGQELLGVGSAAALPPSRLPSQLWTEHREPIGDDWRPRIRALNWAIQARVPLNEPHLFVS